MSAIALIGASSARIADLPAWLVGFLVALIGVAGATWYYQGAFSWWHLIAYLVVAAAALAVGWIGESVVGDNPVQGVRMIGARTLATLLVAGLGAALVIAVAIEIVPASQKPTNESKELFGALSAAVAAAIAGSLVKVTESIDGPAADAAENSLKTAFADLDPTSEAGMALGLPGYRGKWGWGPEDRLWRAEQVATASRAPVLP